MAKRKRPSSLRAEFTRLKAEHERLRQTVEAVVSETREVRRELHITFQRIADMQAILDEEHRAMDRKP